MMVTIVIVITMAISLMTGCSNTTKMPEEVQLEEVVVETEEVVEETAVTVERKLFEPAMIKVENLPEWLTEADLEDGFISTHKLMEIAKNMGKDLELETDSKVYTIKPNMVSHSSIETVAVQEETEEPEVVIEEPTEVAVETPSQQVPSQSAPSQPAQSSQNTQPEQPQNNTQPQEEPKTQEEPSVPQAPSEPKHEHSWVPVYRTVHHEAITEEIWVVDKEAWAEEVTEEIVEWHGQCDACGAILDGWGGDAIGQHMKQHALAGQGTSWGDRKVVVGYNTYTVEHPEEGHKEIKVVKEAYDEEVLDHYECSCGERK